MTTESSYLAAEITSQPADWLHAAAMADDHARALGLPGQRVAVVGCGTSWFVGQVYAALRERSGSWTDAFPASEAPDLRRYDRVVAITRSGTTTEVLHLLRDLDRAVPTTVIVADPDTPVVELVDDRIVLDWADERSVVQSRFATAALALVRAHLGGDVRPASRQAAEILKADAAELLEGLVEAEQITFLGRGWTVGLAHEAALKLRESCQAWAESYPIMEYRHGPISIAEPGRVAWAFGDVPAGLAQEVAATGARFEHRDIDPMADLVRLHRLCVERAAALGLDPDNPRHLTRSIVLEQA